MKEVVGEQLGRLLKVDVHTSKILASSTLDSIRNRKVRRLDDRFVAVACAAGGRGAVRLVSLDSESLQTIAIGHNDIHPASFLIAGAGNVFAITESSGHWVLGNINLDLQLIASSDVPIYPHSAATVIENIMLITTNNGV